MGISRVSMNNVCLILILTFAGVGVYRVNARSHPTSVGWNLGLTRNTPPLHPASCLHYGISMAAGHVQFFHNGAIMMIPWIFQIVPLHRFASQIFQIYNMTDSLHINMSLGFDSLNLLHRFNCIQNLKWLRSVCIQNLKWLRSVCEFHSWTVVYLKPWYIN